MTGRTLAILVLALCSPLALSACSDAAVKQPGLADQPGSPEPREQAEREEQAEEPQQPEPQADDDEVQRLLDAGYDLRLVALYRMFSSGEAYSPAEGHVFLADDAYFDENKSLVVLGYRQEMLIEEKDGSLTESVFTAKRATIDVVDGQVVMDMIEPRVAMLGPDGKEGSFFDQQRGRFVLPPVFIETNE